MAGRDLFGRAVPADPQRHHAAAAGAVHLARRARGFRTRRARAAAAALRAVHGRGRAVLLGGDVPAARRRDHVLSRRPDLRHGALGAAPERAGRLAALGRGAGRLSRRPHRAAALGCDLDVAGADRADGERLLRAADDRHAHAARHARHRADEHADGQHVRVRRGGGAARLGDAVALRPDVPVGLRRGLGRGAVFHQPLSEARARERGRAVPIHDAGVGDPARLSGVRRRARPLHARRLRHHRGGGALHLPPRAARARAIPFRRRSHDATLQRSPASA